MMNLHELIETHRAKTNRPVSEFRLRDREYRKHYPLIKAAVEEGVPLLSAVTILREKESAFEGKTDQAVWQAYRRALKHDNITLSEPK